MKFMMAKCLFLCQIYTTTLLYNKNGIAYLKGYFVCFNKKEHNLYKTCSRRIVGFSVLWSLANACKYAIT